jgi:hypothetical protein
MSRLKLWGVALVAGWLMAAVEGSADVPMRGLVDHVLSAPRSQSNLAKPAPDAASPHASL